MSVLTDRVGLVQRTVAMQPGRSGLRAAVAIGVPTLVLVGHALLYGPWIEDDAGLTFAYARSLALGAGPVLQPGAPAVEGFSNPTWLLVLFVGRLVGLFDHGAWFGVPDLVAFPKAVALACGAGVFAAFYAVARVVSVAPVRVTLVAGVTTALIPSFVVWTVSGLENPLFVLIVVGLAAVLVRAVALDRLLSTRVALTCGLLAAAAALTRPDGLVYGLAFPVVVLFLVQRVEARCALRKLALSTAVFLVPVGCYVVIRLFAFGDVLPNTARAKEQGLPALEEWGKPVDLIAYAGWSAVVVAVAVVTAALTGHRAARPALVALLVPLGLALVAFAALRPDWMAQFRFATPTWPLGSLVSVLAFAKVFPRLGQRPQILGALAVAVATVLSVAGWNQYATTFRANPTAPLCYVALDSGYTINHYADMLRLPNGTLLAVDAGGTALTSRLRLVDLAGLADGPIARFWQDDDMAGLRDHVFDEVRPTFIKLWAGWDGNVRSGLITDARLARDYVLIFSPGGRTGTWVRRDAVPDAPTLVATQRWARVNFSIVAGAFAREGASQRWWCAPVLRPGGPLPRLA